ncbi:MAG: hypothetical protein N2C14_24985 [Planctomycetales bacterium]
MTDIDLDADRAAGIISDLAPDRESQLTEIEYWEILNEQLNRMVTGDRWLKVCDHGRVHTPITNRTIRPPTCPDRKGPAFCRHRPQENPAA